MERWLPRGFEIDRATTVGKLLSAGVNWQLYGTSVSGYAVAISQTLYEKWRELNLLPFQLFKKTDHGVRSVYYISDTYGNMIASVKNGPYPENYEEAAAFATAMKRSRMVVHNISFEDAIYFERYSLILPTYEGIEMDDQTVLCRWISSGVELSLDKFDRLCAIATWISPTALEYVISEAGFSIPCDSGEMIGPDELSEKSLNDDTKDAIVRSAYSIGEQFSLPGRPSLESFFNEHVVDIIRHSDEYKRMGIDFPSAIILHGPPGCGKTFAVEQLVAFLGWPCFRIDSGSIGSPFIHDTSKKISDVFDKAIKSAPSIIVIDEMEAFLSTRDLSQGSGKHHAEEVAEFLRRIPDASKKHVLIIAMTNLIDSIDPAILRRGRFDHIIEVQMPAKEEVESLLHHLFKNIPVCDDVDYDKISSKLEGHPLSDVSFVVKEAGRRTVKANKDMISNDIIIAAIDSLPKEKESSRKIGF